MCAALCWGCGPGRVQGDPAEYPVHKPLHKLSEAIQTTGEAQYLDDLEHAGELHACYVQASHANAALGAVDASQALQLEGVVGFLSAATLQRDGLSNAVGDGEELFASERVVYHGQPVGLVVATSPVSHLPSCAGCSPFWFLPCLPVPPRQRAMAKASSWGRQHSYRGGM